MIANFPENQPRHCFCRYDIRLLLPIYRERFVQGRPTMDLMKEAATPEARDRVAIVAMLEVQDTLVETALSVYAVGENCHILSCRDMLRHQLEILTRDQTQGI